ncbi:hypothetical protein FACS189460_4120 [Deltaproteobacteria bacterium]|nr:hypothetical protein FACS189460_4120 [Deltaproteobacteria bacterium]
MKVIALNGSPRPNWNTGALLEKALAGAASRQAETELIQLYSLKYKGCGSCFACKRKGGALGQCALKDDLTPILEKLKTVDAIIIGSPIYFMNITSALSAFLERFFFPNIIYSPKTPTIFPRRTASGFIYTMNITERQMAEIGLEGGLKFHQKFMETILGPAPEILYSYDTYQFTDYAKYESSKFSEKAKAEHKARQFPLDCENAFQMGRRLAAPGE